jgi:hypothetical protein
MLAHMIHMHNVQVTRALSDQVVAWQNAHTGSASSTWSALDVLMPHSCSLVAHVACMVQLVLFMLTRAGALASIFKTSSRAVRVVCRREP